MEAPSQTQTDSANQGTLAAVLKRTSIGAALIVGLVGGSVGTAYISGVDAQSSSTPPADTSTNAAQQDTAANSVADVAEEVNPAVVTVLNLQAQVDPFSGRQTSDDEVPVSSGSGFIIDEAGHVVTNFHVVDGGQDFQVRYADGTVVSATLVGGDQLQDVAVLQLDLEDGATVPGVAKLGDSDSLRAGDTVVAIGSPYGELTNSVSSGEINAVDRALDTGEGYELPNLLQHNADIYPGNSGGPLIDLNGEVIGINVAKAQYTSESSSDSIGFAIEINAVKEIVNQIINDGTYDRAYLGIQSQTVVSRDGQSITGAEVMVVEDNTPAADAGLQVGDVITEVDGTAIDADNQFVNLLVFDHQPGDTVNLTVERNGETQQVSVTLGTRPTDLTES